MEPPINHPDAYNPGLSDPAIHDGLSFSVGHVDHPGVSIPIEPYTDSNAAYYGSCDPLTALRDNAVGVLIRHAITHVERAWPHYFRAIDEARDTPTEDLSENYDTETLSRLDRLRKLITDSAAYPLQPLFVHSNRNVPLSAHGGDPAERLVTECQMFCAGRFEQPRAEMFYPEPPWQEDWYEHCRDVFTHHAPTRCYTSDLGDCYIVYEPSGADLQDSSQRLSPPPASRIASRKADATHMPYEVAVVRHHPSEHEHPRFAGSPLIIEKLGAAGSLDHTARIVVTASRRAIANDLLELADRCEPASDALQALMEHPRSQLVREALLDHFDHRALDYHGTPQEWGSFGISARNAVGPFVACAPVVDLDHQDPGLEL